MHQMKKYIPYNNSDSYDVGRGNTDTSEDDPPMSRLFIFCDKVHSENDIRKGFSDFGEIEDIRIIRDKDTNENKGFAYVKYALTSDAAKALEEMHGETIGNSDHPLKVFVAASRTHGSNKTQKIDQEQCVRLFIQCSKDTTEQELRDEFKTWGPIDNVVVVRDKNTGTPKGFGFVRYTKFYHAALAFESCSPKYKAKFAEPKASKRSSDDNNLNTGTDSADKGEMSQLLRLQNGESQHTSLDVVVSKSIKQDQLWRLFDIVPGLDYCQIMKEGEHNNEAVVVYHNPESALRAKEKVHGFEYPLGERIIVKLSALSLTNVESPLIEKHLKKDSLCSVPLPPTQPLATSDDNMEKRLFIIMPTVVPIPILKSVFSCWKGLMDVYYLPNKSCGYAKYADKDSALEAMETLNGSEICGIRMKVVEAEEQVKKNDQSSTSDDISRKRLRRN